MCSRHLQRAAEDSDRRTQHRAAPAECAEEGQYSRAAPCASAAQAEEPGTPSSRQPPMEPAWRFLQGNCQPSPARAGGHSADAALCEGCSSGPAVCGRCPSRGVTAGYAGSGARLAAAATQPQPQSAVAECRSCAGPELAGPRAPARQAAQRYLSFECYLATQD